MWSIYKEQNKKHMQGPSVGGISIAIRVEKEYGQFEKEILAAYISHGTTSFGIVPFDTRS
jgi:hypothetical protein